MGIFNFFKKKETNNCSDFENLDTSLKHLWNNGTEKQWKMALNGYYNMLKPNQIEIENYMNNISH